MFMRATNVQFRTKLSAGLLPPLRQTASYGQAFSESVVLLHFAVGLHSIFGLYFIVVAPICQLTLNFQSFSVSINNTFGTSFLSGCCTLSTTLSKCTSLSVGIHFTAFSNCTSFSGYTSFSGCIIFSRHNTFSTTLSARLPITTRRLGEVAAYTNVHAGN